MIRAKFDCQSSIDKATSNRKLDFMTFEHLGLSQEVLRSVHDVCYTTPIPIQQKAIPALLMRRAVLGCAQCGTGKTDCYTSPMLDRLSTGRPVAPSPPPPIFDPQRS